MSEPEDRAIPREGTSPHVLALATHRHSVMPCAVLPCQLEKPWTPLCIFKACSCPMVYRYKVGGMRPYSRGRCKLVLIVLLGASTLSIHPHAIPSASFHLSHICC